MSAVIETKEIGITFGIEDGEHHGTVLVDGVISLRVVGKTEGLENIYEKEGYWQSKVVDIVGKFKEYDKIAVTKTQFTSDLYKIETRTSDNGIGFNDYIALSASSHILSPKKRYIQIKITLYAGLFSETLVLTDFDKPEDAAEWDNNTYIETISGLKLKRNYEYNMTQDSAWVDEGTLLRKAVTVNEWKRVDRIGVE